MASASACAPAPVAPSWRTVVARAASASPADVTPAAVLPAPHRLRASDEFRSVVRSGVRVGRPTLVVHALAKQSPPARAGFVVSKAVGNAVTRNRVKRRLRHLVSDALGSAPQPVDVVVRALPPAASGPLVEDFTGAWRTALGKLAA